MKIGIIKPNYPNEKRVAIVPEDIKGIKNKLIIEEGFGEYLNIADSEYVDVGAEIMSRISIFKELDVIFSLKLLQPSDYNYLRQGQTIIGWTHPTGSGTKFMQEQAIPKQLKIVDLDNIFPAIYYRGKKTAIDFIKPNFIWKNSFNAGFSAVMHALINFGLIPTTTTKVAVLSAGNVSQGALSAINKFNADVRVFYRKTMDEFYNSISNYDIIVNGIEVDETANHIISKQQLTYTKEGCLLIDAAADAGNAIEGTKYTSIHDPIYENKGRYFYVVNNAPSIFFRKSSLDISKAFVKVLFNEDYSKYQVLINKLQKIADFD